MKVIALSPVLGSVVLIFLYKNQYVLTNNTSYFKYFIVRTLKVKQHQDFQSAIFDWDTFA